MPSGETTTPDPMKRLAVTSVTAMRPVCHPAGPLLQKPNRQAREVLQARLADERSNTHTACRPARHQGNTSTACIACCADTLQSHETLTMLLELR